MTSASTIARTGPEASTRSVRFTTGFMWVASVPFQPFNAPTPVSYTHLVRLYSYPVPEDYKSLWNVSNLMLQKTVQKNNLEWLYRLLQDPKRLFKRYLITKTKFIWNSMIRGK